MKYFFKVVIVFSFCLLLFSCTEKTLFTPETSGKVIGKVLNFKTKLPEKGVLVRLNPTGKSVFTDSLGKFSFDSLSVGKYTTRVDKDGLFTEYNTIDIVDSRVIYMEIYVSEDIISNNAPVKPKLLLPLNGEKVFKNSVFFSWSSKDIDKKDTLMYNFVLFKSGESTDKYYVKKYLFDSLTIRELEPNITYYWQIESTDGKEIVKSDLFSFKTPSYESPNYLFVKLIESNKQIFGFNDKNKSSRQLTTLGNNWRPVVSPNRELIAFLSDRYYGETHLYTMNLDGSNVKKVTKTPLNSLFLDQISFCWAENGSKLVFPNYTSLFSVNYDGTGMLKIVSSSNGNIFVGCDWNEYSKKIVAKSLGKSFYDSEILLIEGERTEVLFKEDKYISNPIFNSIGNEIVFSKDISEFRDYSNRVYDSHLFLFNMKERTLKDLTLNSNLNEIGNNNITDSKPLGTNDLEPRFSPNDKFLIFTNTQNDNLSSRFIYTINILGNDRKKLFENAFMPYWRSFE